MSDTKKTPEEELAAEMVAAGAEDFDLSPEEEEKDEDELASEMQPSEAQQQPGKSIPPMPTPGGMAHALHQKILSAQIYRQDVL